jgi:cell division transport system permease protein
MKFRTLKYHIRQGVFGLLKNRLMTLAAIITVMACIFTLIISLCIVENISYIIEQFESKIGINIFIKDTVSDEDLSMLEQKFKEISHVSEVKYISKEEALEQSKGNIASADAKMWEGLEKDNPLPRSFVLMLDSSENQRAVINSAAEIQKNYEEGIISKSVEKNFTERVSENASEEVSGEDSAQGGTISDQVKDSSDISLEEYKNAEISVIGSADYEYKGIYKIQASQSAADSLAAIKNTIRIIGIVLIVVMGIIATGIIINTIKLTVLLRKNEINIMKYVGATDGFIRGPFIVEGLLIGIIGAIIPCVISWIFYGEIISAMYNEFSIIKRLFEFCPSSEIFSFVIPVALIIGGGLGALGSITSIRKHLNV